MPGRYRYRVLDTRVLLGIGIASIHFLNDRYLKGWENKEKRGKIQADI